MVHSIQTSARSQALQLSKIREVFNLILAAEKKGQEIINLSVGRPDFDTPDQIKAAAITAIQQGHVHYTASPGTEELREVISTHLKNSWDLKYRFDQILVTTGATQAMMTCALGLFNPGDEVLVPEPYYVYYPGWTEMAGAKFVAMPLNQDTFQFTAEDVASKLTPKTKALILTSPHNPTGTVFAPEELEKIAAMAVDNNFVIISDDIYNTLLFDDVPYTHIGTFPEMAERTIVINSLSKSHAMDGWRVGYMAVPEHLYGDILKVHQYTISCPNTFVQKAAIAALTCSQADTLNMVAEFDRRRLLITDWLKEVDLPCSAPQGAFYFFPSIRRYGLSSSEFCEYLLKEKGVALVPGNAFGSNGEGFVRLSYAVNYESLEKGLTLVSEGLAKLG